MDKPKTESRVSSSCKLEVYAAVYGLCDVTEKVKSLIKPDDQSLKFKVSNDVFGENWKARHKTFVIVYKYNNTEDSDVKKMFMIEDDTLEIRPQPEPTMEAQPVLQPVPQPYVGKRTLVWFANYKRKLTVV